MKTIILLIFTCLAINQCLSQWQLTIGGTAEDCANCIIQTSDGGYAIAGYTYSFGAGNSDMYFVKIDSTGLIQWTRTVGGSGLDYAFSISQTPDGGYIGAGYTNSFGSTQYWHMYIVKLSSDGTVQWTKMGGETNNDRNYSIIQTMNGDMLLLVLLILMGQAVPICIL